MSRNGFGVMSNPQSGFADWRINNETTLKRL